MTNDQKIQGDKTLWEFNGISQAAFLRAVTEKRLSLAVNVPNSVRHYMYIGTDKNGRDLFKHEDTREYLK